MGCSISRDASVWRILNKISFWNMIVKTDSKDAAYGYVNGKHTYMQ